MTARRRNARWPGILAGAVVSLLACSAVEAQCTIAVTAGVAFGNYDVFDTAVKDSAGEVRVSCTVRRTNVRVTLDPGKALSFQPRKMENGLERLEYNLYLDANRSEIWGDGTGGSLIFGPVTINRNQTRIIPVYGRVPPTQDVAAGLYSDLVVATVLF